MYKSNFLINLALIFSLQSIIPIEKKLKQD